MQTFFKEIYIFAANLPQTPCKKAPAHLCGGAGAVTKQEVKEV